jgi:hypothetical protein
MPNAEVDLCNRALSRLGTRATIAALSENSTEARTVSIWYAATRDALLRVHDWNFARRRVALADLGSPSPRDMGNWAYRFALPSDCLRLLRLETLPGLPSPRFEVARDGAGRIVLCDEPAPLAVYTARITDPSLFDTGFAQALVDQLAAHVAYPVTQKTDLAVRLAQAARLALAEAMTADSGEVGSGVEEMPDWIAARA